MSQIRLWVTYWLCNLYFAGLLALALTEFCGGFIIMERRNLRFNFSRYPSIQLVSAHVHHRNGYVPLTDFRRLKLEARSFAIMPS